MYEDGEKWLLSPKEFVEGLHGAVGQTKLREYLKGGRVKSIRNGKRYLIPRSELTDWPARELADGQ